MRVGAVSCRCARGLEWLHRDLVSHLRADLVVTEQRPTAPGEQHKTSAPPRHVPAMPHEGLAVTGKRDAGWLWARSSASSQGHHHLQVLAALEHPREQRVGLRIPPSQEEAPAVQDLPAIPGEARLRGEVPAAGGSCCAHGGVRAGGKARRPRAAFADVLLEPLSAPLCA